MGSLHAATHGKREGKPGAIPKSRLPTQADGGIAGVIAYFLFFGRAISAGLSAGSNDPARNSTQPVAPRGAAKNRQGLSETSSDTALSSPGSPSRTQTTSIGTRIMQVWIDRHPGK